MKYVSTAAPRIGLFNLVGESRARCLRTFVTAGAAALAAAVLLSFADAGTARGAEAADTSLPAVTGSLPSQQTITLQSVPKLRSSVTVSSDVVTIGDFFEGAGALARIPLFRSPDLGTSGPVSARRVVDLATAAGLRDAGTDGLVEVEVSRLARSVESTEIQRLIAVEAMRRPGRSDDVSIDDLEVTFDLPVEPRRADVRSAEPVRIVSFSMSPVGGRFDALVQIDKGDGTERLHLRGAITETVTVATLARALSRGDAVAPEDIQIERQPRTRTTSVRTRADPRDFAGLQARRSLRAGQPVVVADFMKPQVVTRGDAVTLIYRSAVLQVSSRGQAMQSGSVGELIAVLNPQSKRTVHAVVTGPGRVEVSAAPTTVAAAGQPSKVTP